MKRLTDPYEKYISSFPEAYRGKDKSYRLDSGIVMEKLGAYEDLEENGKMLILPCKRGDRVWRIVQTVGGEVFVVKGFVRDIIIAINTMPIDQESITKEFYFMAEGDIQTQMHHNIWLKFEEFGKTVFFNEDDAKSALEKKMKGKL